MRARDSDKTLYLNSLHNDSRDAVALAEQAIKRHDWKAAQVRWRDCFNLYKEQVQPRWYWALGKAFLVPGRLDDAESTFRSMIEKFPDDVGGYVGLAQVAEKRGDWEVAEHRWRTCFDRFEAQAQARWFFGLGKALLTLDRMDDAESTFRSMIEKFPDEFEGHAGLARVAAWRQEWRTSAEYWNILATRFDMQMTRSDHIARANALCQSGDFTTANAVLRDLINDYPDEPQVLVAQAINAENQRDVTSERQLWIEVYNRFPDVAKKDRRFWRNICQSHLGASPITIDLCSAVNDPEDAQIDLSILNISNSGSDTLFAAGCYAEEFPNSEKMQLSLLKQLHQNLRSPADLDNLLVSADEICRRFPESKAVWTQKAYAQVSASALDETKRTVDHIEKRFGRCVFTDQINAWTAQADGDLDRAKRFSDRVVRENFWFALDGPLKRFERIDSNRDPSFKDKILLFCIMKDERPFLPWFFDYYRSIGIDWFFVVDNDSTDGSAEYACHQRDTTVFWTDDAFYPARSGMRWINEMISRYGDDNWCVYVDIDEQLIVPKVEEKGLRPVLDDMRARDEEVMFGFMLDMYPNKLVSLESSVSNDNPLQSSPNFDVDYLALGYWESPYKMIRGGARDRIFGTFEQLTKAPIIRGSSQIRYLTAHTTTAANVSSVSNILLHYKILRDGWALSQSGGVNENPRLKDRSPGCQRRHHRYHDVLENIGRSEVPKAVNAQIYKSSTQLIQLGLINANPENDRDDWFRNARNRHADLIDDVATNPAESGKTTSLLQQWQRDLDSFPWRPQPNWFRGPAPTFLALDRLDEAEGAFNVLVDRYPRSLNGYAGLAQIAMRREDWAQAIEHWQDCFEYTDYDTKPHWALSYGLCLQNIGRPDEAPIIYRHAINGGAVSPEIKRALAEVLIETRELDQLTDEYRTGVFKNATRDVDDLRNIRSLITYNRQADARSTYDLIFNDLATGSAYKRCLVLIPLLFDGLERKRRYSDLMTAAAERLKQNDNAKDSALLLAARLGCLLALRDYQTFETCATHLDQISDLPEVLQPFIDIRRRLRGYPISARDKKKIFGIGLSKTATSSLTIALKVLGFSAVHWINPVTHEIICDDDFPLFDTFTDTPICFQFELLYQKFPDARFIYTTRPIETWLRSFSDHLSKLHDIHEFKDFGRMLNHPDGCRHGKYFRTIHENLFCRHDSAEQAYWYHDQRVRRFFTGSRKSQLLEFDVFSGDGWNKLCHFLEKPIPSIPFPWDNRNPLIYQ